jgi:hypothetical protein
VPSSCGQLVLVVLELALGVGIMVDEMELRVIFGLSRGRVDMKATECSMLSAANPSAESRSLTFPSR